MPIPNDFTFRADQKKKQRVKSLIKRFRSTVFGLNNVHSHIHTHVICTKYILYLWARGGAVG